MITKILWNAFKGLKLTEKVNMYSEECTPSEMAFIFIACMIMTPLLIVLDLILIPAEVMFYYVKRYYERKLENE